MVAPKAEAMAEAFDPYAVLGVRRGASIAEIAHARRALAKQFHPDSAGAEGEEAMRRINLAWEMLAAECPAVELPPPWARPDPPVAYRAREPQSAGGSHAGWWALAVVSLLMVALFVSVILGSLDNGAAPESAPWLQHNLGN
jgi:hypothetical protein